MPSIVTQTFKNRQVDAFLSLLAESKAYIFVGNSYPWEDEEDPPIPIDNDGSYFNVWDRIYGMKLVPGGSYGKVIRRRDWKSGEVYSMYSTNMGPISSTPFYVMHEYRVYKCIWNNYGAASIDPPTTTESMIYSAIDGYIWSYMYTIDTASAQKFLTPEYMPVLVDTTVQEDASLSMGIVTGVMVTSPGAGFTSVNAIGGTTDAILYPTIDPVTLEILSVEVIDGGDGYVAPVTFTTTRGSGAAFTATVSGGRITEVAVTNGGSGYQPATINIVSGSGTGFAAKAITQNGQLIRVDIDDAGEGYTFLRLEVTGHADDQDPATVEPILAPILGHGYNAEEELGASNIMFTTLFAPVEVEGYIPPNNRYRNIGLILDPAVYGDPATPFEQNIGTNLIKLRQTAGTSLSFIRNELITDTVTGAQGKLVHWDEDAGEMWLVRTQQENFIPFVVGNDVEGADSGKIITVAEITNPDLAKYTGQIHYIENREPVQRTTSQFEEIKIVIEF